MIPNSPIEYPVFKKGDPLKSSDLNNLISYLEGEELDTRVFLIGSGVFYGLTPTWDPATAKLTISNGAGVSSDGFLFTGNLTNQQGALVPLVYNDLGNEVTIPLPGNGGITGQLLTFTEQTPTDALATRINANDVVLLYLRAEETVEEDCLRSYENSGTRKKYTLEAMLAPMGQLDAQIGRWDTETPPPIAEGQPFMERFGFGIKDPGGPYLSFGNFTSWKSMRENFNFVCTGAEFRISAAYNAMYAAYARLLGMNEALNPFANMAATLASARARINIDNSVLARQLPYYYDYLRDLISAYQEFFRTGLLIQQEVPDESRFVKYIALGNCGPNRTPEMSKYRMGLYRPPFADVNQGILDKLTLLMNRMKHMADIGNTLFKEGGNLPATLSFSPSAALSAPLSHRAIPFYYINRDDSQDVIGLKHYWNYDAVQQRRLFSVPGIDETADKTMLLRDMDAYNFFRIQGHIGKTAKDAQQFITELRSDLHLPFDIKVVFIGTDDIANEMVSEETAWFSDLGLLLEKVVSDIRCENECGDDYETKIFDGASDNMNIGAMFEALGVFFSGVTDQNWENWVGPKCEDICARPAARLSGEQCCPLHLKLLYDLYKDYKRRKEEAMNQLFFHKFAATHPGLEHNAGVPKGGTLVLVCADEGSLDEQHEAFVARLKSLKSLDAAAKATVIREIAVLSDYRVVADFCLPYTCCSGTPSVRLELREVQPEADFEIAGEPAPLDEGGKWRYTFHNLSRNANHFQWDLFDIQGPNPVKKQTKETTDVNDPLSFDLEFGDGAQYMVRLTARRGPLFQQAAKNIYFCPPAASLELDHDGEDSFTWKKNTEVIALELNARPYGGEFFLYKSTGGNEWMPVYEDFSISWLPNKQGISFVYDELPVGSYRLDYAFVECNVHVSFSIEIEESDSGPVDTVPATDIKAVYNKRLQQYRKAVSSIGDDDKTLGKTEKFGKTEAFLRFSGKQPELHNRYSDVLKSLQTGMANAGEKRQQQVADLVTYSTLFYLDRLLANAPDAVADEAKPLLQEAAGFVKGQPEGLKRLLELWDAPSITNDQNTAALNTYKTMLS